MEDDCIFIATALSTGKNDFRLNLSEAISRLHFETRSRLYKQQITNLIYNEQR